ncbi:hypothetical protein CYLTODRAFT_420777, partial [Cylindrobasidium torrendii FP15055 ss-10]
MTDLPFELLSQIVGYAARLDTETALALCLVNKTVRSWAEPVLYHTIIVNSPELDKRLLTCLKLRIAHDPSFFERNTRNLIFGHKFTLYTGLYLSFIMTRLRGLERISITGRFRENSAGLPPWTEVLEACSSHLTHLHVDDSSLLLKPETLVQTVTHLLSPSLKEIDWISKSPNAAGDAWGRLTHVAVTAILHRRFWDPAHHCYWDELKHHIDDPDNRLFDMNYFINAPEDFDFAPNMELWIVVLPTQFPFAGSQLSPDPRVVTVLVPWIYAGSMQRAVWNDFTDRVLGRERLLPGEMDIWQYGDLAKDSADRMFAASP